MSSSGRTKPMDALTHLPVFQGLPTTELQWLLDNGQKLELAKGDFLMCEGDPAPRFYITLAGELQITPCVCRWRLQEEKAESYRSSSQHPTCQLPNRFRSLRCARSRSPAGVRENQRVPRRSRIAPVFGDRSDPTQRSSRARAGLRPRPIAAARRTGPSMGKRQGTVGDRPEQVKASSS